METRPLGKPRQELSIIGVGEIVFVGGSQRSIHETVARAVDSGVNYFDMGPRYVNGEAEELG